MNSFAPLALVLVLLAAGAVLVAGPAGAGAAAIVGVLLTLLAVFLVRSEEVEGRTGAGRRREADARFLVFLVVAAFALRAVLAIVLRQLDLNMVLGGDEGTFDGNAKVFAEWLHGRLPEPFQAKWRGSSQKGYFVLVGSIYWLIGPQQIVPVLLNCAIGSLTAIPVYRVASRLGGGVAGRIAAVLVAFFPSLVLWSCLMVRDALAFYLIAAAASLGQSLLRRVTFSHALLLIAALGALATLRSYVFLLLAGGLVGAFLVSVVRRPGRAFAVALLSVVGVFLLVRGAGLGAELLPDATLARIDTQRRLNALVGTAAIEMGDHDLSTPTGALSYLPVGILHFLLAPFPWQTGGRQLLALPDMLIWYACLPLVLLGARRALRAHRSQAAVPLLSAAAITLLYALVEGNVGIIVRHRAQIVVLLLPFAGVALARLLRQRRRRLAEERAERERRVHAAAALRAGRALAGVR